MLPELCMAGEHEASGFVGMYYQNGQPRIVFPRGYRLPTTEEDARHEIVNLLSIIHTFSGRHEGAKNIFHEGEDQLDFPLLSYQFIIRDFLNNGYYTEIEINYNEAVKGKISWKKTIQKIKPRVDNNNAVYLKFITKANRINKNSLLMLIHQYCVYESFSKIGWLFLNSEALPPKPQIKFDSTLFLTALRDALNSTFSDRKRKLLTSMINIIQYAEDHVSSTTAAAFGVYRFEYIWEALIDCVYGISNKEQYFPHGRWHILTENGGYNQQSSELKPDTIARIDDKYYILDAKYYQYGITKNPAHLPATDSIQKQITYGRYIEQQHHTDGNRIYNAFLMPFTKDSSDPSPYRFVSVGTADWENYSINTPNYKYVLGILVDTHFLLTEYCRYNTSEILTLCSLIENSLQSYRTSGTR